MALDLILRPEIRWFNLTVSGHLVLGVFSAWQAVWRLAFVY